jgi:hypothetical protein
MYGYVLVSDAGSVISIVVIHPTAMMMWDCGGVLGRIM